MTILEALKGVNAYPVPVRAIDEVALNRGLTLTDTATQEVLRSAGYNLALADLYLWLSVSPDISQGGQSYSFTDEQRASLRRRAYALYREWGDEGGGDTPKTAFGYKGSRL